MLVEWQRLANLIFLFSPDLVNQNCSCMVGSGTIRDFKLPGWFEGLKVCVRPMQRSFV